LCKISEYSLEILKAAFEEQRLENTLKFALFMADGFLSPEV
jgi:hypothetical protein